MDRYRLALIALLSLLVLAPAASAAEFTVTTTADGNDAATGDGICKTAIGACTLRAALQQANALAGVDVITVPAGTYATVTGGVLPVTQSVTVRGAGPAETVIDAGGASQVLAVSAGAVTLQGLTVTGGKASDGAGIGIQSADVTLEDAVVRDNVADGLSTRSGGGIQVFSGSLVLRDSAIVRNTIRSNGASALGGGVEVGMTASLLAERSTIAANVSEGYNNGSYAYGGGLINFGTAILRHTTLYGNRAQAGSGGNLYAGGGASTQLEDSVIANGTAAFGANCSGTLPTTGGRNLDSGATCALPAPSLSNTDPKLGALGVHGGGTESLVPLAGSPLLDATSCGDRPTDQRGQTLPAGPACDIGATELGADLAVSSAGGTGSTAILLVRNEGLDDAPDAQFTVDVAGATVTLASASQGTCAGTGPVTCQLGTLAPGAAVTLTLVVAPAAGCPAVSVTGHAASAVADPDGTDDQATMGLPGACTPPAGGQTPAGGGTGSAPAPTDRTAPVLSKVKLGGRLTARRGGRLRLTLSEAATVRVVVERVVPGRRSGKRCAAVRAGTRVPKAKRCTRYVAVFTLHHPLAGGARKLTIPRRSGRRALRAGRVRLTVTATDAAGNASRPVRLSATVKAR